MDTFDRSYNGTNYVINKINLVYPDQQIYCISLKDNIPHTLLLLYTNCDFIKGVRVNKRYYESDDYLTYETLITNIINQEINKCNNDKGLRVAFEKHRRLDSDEEPNTSINPEIEKNTIRSTFGSSVNIETVKLPINKELCYELDNKYYGEFIKYRGDPDFIYSFENGGIRDKSNINVNVVDCYDPNKVTISYVKRNPDAFYEYYDQSTDQLIYLGRYIKDDIDNDNINYHYFTQEKVPIGKIKYVQIVP